MSFVMLTERPQEGWDLVARRTDLVVRGLEHCPNPGRPGGERAWRLNQSPVATSLASHDFNEAVMKTLEEAGPPFGELGSA